LPKDPDPRFQGGFDTALMLMRLGASIRRAGWPEGDSFVMADGIMLTMIGRKRVHSIPVGDILAMDWTVAICHE
jgi:hypothetical protein